MSLLILMRHAKAVREHEAASDRVRDLTEAGLRDAAAAAAAIRDAGFAPARMLASPASRTRMTAHAAREALPSVTELVLVEPLYLATAETIWAEVRDAFTATGMMVVGHNPGLHELAAAWIERDRDRSSLARALTDGMATSAWAAFEVEEDAPFGGAVKLLGGSASRGGG